MTANLAAAVAPFTISVAVGKDVVPRMSVVNIGRLLDQIVRSPVCLLDLVHTCCTIRAGVPCKSADGSLPPPHQKRRCHFAKLCRGGIVATGLLQKRCSLHAHADFTSMRCAAAERSSITMHLSEGVQVGKERSHS